MKEVELDCMGEICPVPVIRAQEKIEELAVGDLLIVLIDHSCSLKNLPDWAREAGHNAMVKVVDPGDWEVIF